MRQQVLLEEKGGKNHESTPQLSGTRGHGGTKKATIFGDANE